MPVTVLSQVYKTRKAAEGRAVREGEWMARTFTPGDFDTYEDSDYIYGHPFAQQQEDGTYLVVSHYTRKHKES